MRIFLFVFVVVVFGSCSRNKIVNPADYAFALKPLHLQKAISSTNKEISFWNQRLNTDTNSYVNMLELGYQYLALFGFKGNIQDLKKGDELIKNASARLNHTDPDILQAISQASITQHRFKEAAYYNDQAFKNNGSAFTHALLSFDAGMETGGFLTAKKQLRKLKDQDAFHVLIRKAKLQDHGGDLDGAIKTMERALFKLKHSNNISLYCWALSNLGDMYSHAGRIEEAYSAYLGVLKKDPSYQYVFKGIAWIAYAHDRNTKEAKRLLKFILSGTNAPDLLLILGEMEAYEGNVEEQKKLVTQFLSTVANPDYGDMYNKYLIEVYTEEIKNFDGAEHIAQKEIINRPTPETFSWLAWVYFKKGDLEKAHTIYNNYVKGRDFEPVSLYRGAYILKAVGRKEEAKKFFEESLESSFELGPVITKMIKEELAKF
jgi:tetratricopeptide (TPR) repeat protein